MSLNAKKYSKVSFYYLIGNVFNKGMSFLTVPIFTRLLTTHDYGFFSTYNSYVSIVAMILGFVLHMAIRAAFIDYREKIDDFVSTICFFTIVITINISTIIVIGYKLIDVNVSFAIIILCLLQGFSNAIIEDYSMYLMMKFKYKFRTLLMVLPNLLSVGLSVLVIFLLVNSDAKYDLYWGRIIPTAICYIVFCVIILFVVFKKSKVLLKKEYVIYGLKISAPLILHGLSLNILSQSDRIMITMFDSTSNTGIYSLVYNFSMLATVLTTSLDGVWIPWFTEKFQKRKFDDINKVAVNYVSLMTFAMIILLLVSPEILKLFATKSYWEGIAIIPPLVLSNYIIFVYSLYVNIEHYHKKTVFITSCTLVAAISNIALNLIFIPIYGYMTAAFTTLFSYIVSCVLHMRYSKKLEKSLFPVRIFIPAILTLLVAVFIFYFFMELPIVRWALMIVLIIFIIIREYDRLLELVRMMFKKNA